MDDLHIGYKMVRVDGQRLTSATNDVVGLAGVEYEKGVWSIPKQQCGPLALFIDAYTARNFHDGYSDNIRGGVFQIWQCVFIPSPEECVYFPSLWNRSAITHFYKGHLPMGTTLAMAIKLIQNMDE